MKQTWYQKNRRSTLIRVHRYYKAHRKERIAYGRKWYRANKDKARELNKKWQLENKEKAARFKKFSVIKRKYGIDKKQYRELVQNGDRRCYNCRKYKKLCVDHNRRTGKVHGMLCIGCNTALGSLKENKKFIKGLIQYLNKYD